MKSYFLKIFKKDNYNLPHVRFFILVAITFSFLLGLTYFDAGIFYKSILLILFFYLNWVVSEKYGSSGIWFLIFWFAFESVFLKYFSQDTAAYLRYLPEVVLYTQLFFLLIHRWINGDRLLIKTPINSVFLGILFLAFFSSLWNGLPVITAVLGIRQLIRFILVFYLVVYAGVSRATIRKFIILLFGITFCQSLIGLLQYFNGGALDRYLVSDTDFFIGNDIIVAGGVEQFWESGTFVSGTFRRYNELGAFFSLISVVFISFFYTYRDLLKKKSNKKYYIYLFFGFVAFFATFLLTYARAAWLATFFGMMIVAVFVYRDKKIMYGITVIVACVFLYLGSFVLINNVSVEVLSFQRSSGFAERILNTFSRVEFEGSLSDFGRLYFILKTPKVVALSPFIGVGPGMYGGGVAATLNNREAYDRAGIAFGIYGETGQIDNNWFSIWGELGTLGLILFLVLFFRLYQSGYYIYRQSKDLMTKMLGGALQGMVVVAVIISFFAPYFEIRTFAFYFWLLAGCTVSLAIEKNKVY